MRAYLVHVHAVTPYTLALERFINQYSSKLHKFYKLNVDLAVHIVQLAYHIHLR